MFVVSAMTLLPQSGINTPPDVVSLRKIRFQADGLIQVFNGLSGIGEFFVDPQGGRLLKPVHRREGQDLILCNLRIFHDGCAFDVGTRHLQGFPFGLGYGGDPGVIGRLASPEGLCDGVGDDFDFPEGADGMEQYDNQKGN